MKKVLLFGKKGFDSGIVPCGDFNCSDGWNLKSNTTIENGQLTIDTTIDGVYYENAVSNVQVESGKTYGYEIDIETNTDVLFLKLGSNVSDWIALNGVTGKISGTHTVTTTWYIILEDRHSTTGTYVINSLKVWEI